MKLAAGKTVPEGLVRQAVFLDIRMRSRVFSKEEHERLIELSLLKLEDIAVRELAAIVDVSRESTISPIPEVLPST